MFDVIYLIIPLIILLIILLIIRFNKTENFTNEFKKIKYYIIHLERSIDRLENLDIQIKKLNKDIIYFPAIDGNTLDYNKLLEDNIIQKEYWNRIQKKGVYGCYLSHYKLIEKLKNEYDNNLLNSDYSVIFEDDFKIVVDDLDYEINNIIININELNIDFDIIYLGDSQNTHGGLIINNIYQFNNSHMYGDCYLINNKSLHKIYNNLHVIDEAIDWKLRILIMNGKLNALMINPTLVLQLSHDTLKSEIDVDL
jgi:GR25 family glycosyltransferase involved in LPS biosynthesis